MLTWSVAYWLTEWLRSLILFPQSRSGNILAHLAAELEKAEGSGGADRLMASHGSQGSRGTYPGANPQRRRTSDPDFLTTLGYSNGR